MSVIHHRAGFNDRNDERALNIQTTAFQTRFFAERLIPIRLDAAIRWERRGKHWYRLSIEAEKGDPKGLGEWFSDNVTAYEERDRAPED